MKPRRTKELKDAEAEWYAKLKVEGFQDIEDISNPDRPLKAWHSSRFKSESSLIRQAKRAEYDKQIEKFLNHPHFDELCRLIAKRDKRVTVTPEKVKNILYLHNSGCPERKIAETINCHRTTVTLTLKKAKEWMKVA